MEVAVKHATTSNGGFSFAKLSCYLLLGGVTLVAISWLMRDDSAKDTEYLPNLEEFCSDLGFLGEDVLLSHCYYCLKNPFNSHKPLHILPCGHMFHKDCGFHMIEIYSLGLLPSDSCPVPGCNFDRYQLQSNRRW